jgi:hypothetical protein
LRLGSFVIGVFVTPRLGLGVREFVCCKAIRGCQGQALA